MNTIPPDWKPWQHILYQRVGNPATELEFLQSRSPFFQVGKIKSPLLIAQGANDPRVPRAESIQIRDALKASGKEVEYVEFPDEGAWLRAAGEPVEVFCHGGEVPGG